ncbi:MAG: nucleotidyltransferase domain-containing protein [Deltaproteobacteria bacterium]|nr:nucleotidyltransferase domain-containing protein [Deltaproteobacteria bacterium]
MRLASLKKFFANRSEVVAAYLFGSVAKGEPARDLDILLLLRPEVDADTVYFDLAASLSDTLGIPEDKVDLLFFDMDEADPMVVYEALSTGILLKNSNPDMLSDNIDALSQYFLENDVMIERARQLRNDRLEEFCANR